MKKINKKVIASLLCFAALNPVLYACSCNKEEQTQKVEYKIIKGNAPHGTYTLEYDETTKKVKVIAIPDSGYEFSRAYYVHTDNPTIEYTIDEDGFVKPNANITVHVVFSALPEQPPVIEAQLNIQQPSYGNITSSVSDPDAGDTVNITVTPNEGYFVNRLYYTKSDGTDVEISNKTFTMIDEPITVKTELVAFFGTYKLNSITNHPNENELLEESKENYSFINIDTKITVGMMVHNQEKDNMSYSLNTYSYLISDNTLTYTDSNDVVHSVNLSDGVFKETNDYVYEYKMIEDSTFTYGRYNRIDYTSGDMDYVWTEDGNIELINSSNTGEFISSAPYGSAKLYGDILVLNKGAEGNIINIFLVKKEATHFTLNGISITVGDTESNYDNVSMSFASDPASGITTLAPTEFGSASLSYNPTTAKIEVIATPETGYVLDRVFYVREGSTTKNTIPSSGFFRPARDNITVYVTFKVDPNYPVRVEIDDNTIGGEIILNTRNILEVGDEVSITTTANEGYYLKEVYYLTSDNEKVIINNDKFTMIDDTITVHATFIKYYGSYFVSSVVDSTGTVIPGSGSILENNQYNFLYIDSTGVYMPLIETVEEVHYSKYEIIKGSYVLSDTNITFTFKVGSKTLTQVLDLQDGVLRSTYATDTYLLFALAKDSGFTPGPYEVTEITETLTEFIFNEDGTVTSTTNGNRTEIGTYTRYGNTLLITNNDGTLDVCTLTKSGSNIIVAGIRINFANTDINSSNTNQFYWTFLHK